MDSNIGTLSNFVTLGSTLGKASGCFVLFCSINLDRTPLCFHRPTHPTETTLGVLCLKTSDVSENQYSHFWKNNTCPDKRTCVENDKFCVFATLLLVVYLFVFVLVFTSETIIQYEKIFRDDVIVLSVPTPLSLNFQFSFNNKWKNGQNLFQKAISSSETFWKTLSAIIA